MGRPTRGAGRTDSRGLPAGDHAPRIIGIVSPAEPSRERPAELVVLVGLQASGKSTFCRERFAATHVHVSKDELRNVRQREARQRELVQAWRQRRRNW